MRNDLSEAELRYELSQKNGFQGRVLIVALAKCHEIMNKTSDIHDRLRAKAQDIITNPASYKETLALSVSALLPKDNDGTFIYDDGTILKTIDDAFDALAGVTP